MDTIKAIITTLDNLPLLKEQLDILRGEESISEVIVVNNGSRDGTEEYLATQLDVVTINKDNNGAGPGRNAGLDMAEPYDYILILDGGIRPLRGGVKAMHDYLKATSEADVIGVEIPHFETDYTKAWRRWPKPIGPNDTYRNTRLSHTAYCMARFKAFDGLRFNEYGPFGQPGWGADDDEMCYQWNDANIVTHVVVDIHPYRRGSGSFRRLFLETGVWPNQYGSVYEQRVVWLQQNYAKYQPGVQWGEPTPARILTIDVDDFGTLGTIKEIKRLHDLMRKDKLDKPYEYAWTPYSITVRCPSSNKVFLEWAEVTRLRHHHGDTIVVNGEVIRKNGRNNNTWTGDFILDVMEV